jgi:hypothetical protein
MARQFLSSAIAKSGSFTKNEIVALIPIVRKRRTQAMTDNDEDFPRFRVANEVIVKVALLACDNKEGVAACAILGTAIEQMLQCGYDSRTIHERVDEIIALILIPPCVRLSKRSGSIRETTRDQLRDWIRDQF